MKNTAHSITFVIVQRLLEHTCGHRTAIGHQILSNESARVGQSIGKLRRRRKKQEPRRFCSVRAQNYGLGFLEMRVPLGVKVDCAGSMAGFVDLNLVNIGIWPDLALASFLCNSDHGGQRRRLCSYFATKTKAEPAIHTSTSARTRLRENCHRGRKGVVTEFSRCLLKQDPRTLHRQRRHRIRLRTRWIKWAARPPIRKRRLPSPPSCSKVQDRCN